MQQAVPNRQLPGRADRSDGDREPQPFSGKILGKLGLECFQWLVGSSCGGATEPTSHTHQLCMKLGGVGELEEPQAGGIGDPHHDSQRGVDLLFAESAPSGSRSEKRRGRRLVGMTRAVGQHLAGWLSFTWSPCKTSLRSWQAKTRAETS